MKIILDESLEPLELHEWQAKRDIDKTIYIISANAAKAANISRNQMQNVRPMTPISILSPRGYLNILSTAYDRHYSIVLHPHDLWYIVLTQIAEEVSNNPSDYRSLFTSSDDKQKIIVGQDHPTDININKLIEKLRELVPGSPDTIDLFLPELSTITPEARLAHAAAFVSTVSQYYDYGMFCCGIPSVHLKGTEEDWYLLAVNCLNLGDVFADSKKMIDYFIRVHKLFKKLATMIWAGPDIEFMKDIYRQNNVGSGGDLSVNGWITQLYIKGANSLIKSFHDTMSAFTYENVSTKQKFVMVHGAFGANFVADHTLEAVYDHTTFEILDDSLAEPESNEIHVVKVQVGGPSNRKLLDDYTIIETQSGFGVEKDE